MCVFNQHRATTQWPLRSLRSSSAHYFQFCEICAISDLQQHAIILSNYSMDQSCIIVVNCWLFVTKRMLNSSTSSWCLLYRDDVDDHGLPKCSVLRVLQQFERRHLCCRRCPYISFFVVFFCSNGLNVNFQNLVLSVRGEIGLCFRILSAGRTVPLAYTLSENSSGINRKYFLDLKIPFFSQSGIAR